MGTRLFQHLFDFDCWGGERKRLQHAFKLIQHQFNLVSICFNTVEMGGEGGTVSTSLWTNSQNRTAAQTIHLFSERQSILLCLTPDDFTRQWGTPGSQCVKGK